MTYWPSMMPRQSTSDAPLQCNDAGVLRMIYMSTCWVTLWQRASFSRTSDEYSVISTPERPSHLKLNTLILCNKREAKPSLFSFQIKAWLLSMHCSFYIKKNYKTQSASWELHKMIDTTIGILRFCSQEGAGSGLGLHFVWIWGPFWKHMVVQIGKKAIQKP